MKAEFLVLNSFMGKKFFYIITEDFSNTNGYYEGSCKILREPCKITIGR